ncbi:hypothetical protein ACJX0J_010010, partial [Zea mays]
VKTVKVSNLSLNALKREITEFFSFSGDIEYVEMQSESEWSQLAYVTFKDSQGADTAVLLSFNFSFDAISSHIFYFFTQTIIGADSLLSIWSIYRQVYIQYVSTFLEYVEQTKAEDWAGQRTTLCERNTTNYHVRNLHNADKASSAQQDPYTYLLKELYDASEIRIINACCLLSWGLLRNTLLPLLLYLFWKVALGGIGRTIDFLWTMKMFSLDMWSGQDRTGDAIMGVLTDMKASFQEAMQHATILWYEVKMLKDFAFATIYRHVVFDLNVHLLSPPCYKILVAVDIYF